MALLWRMGFRQRHLHRVRSDLLTREVEEVGIYCGGEDVVEHL